MIHCFRLAALSVAIVGLLLTGNATAQLSASLINGNFDTNTSAPVIDDWGEHEIYAGPGPNGFGIYGGFGAPVPGSSGGTLGMIRGNDDPSSAVAMQSLGTVDASDVGKTFEVSAGAVAWDWYLDFDVPVSYSGEITLSFRDGATPDDGDFANYNYGTLLGTPDSVITSVASGNGTQDGIGDDNGLLPLTATYSPSAGDIGKVVSVVVNLDGISNNFGGENRYIVDNATITVIPEPGSIALIGLGMIAGFIGRRRRT